jgi:DNA-binding NarL/FixJ family response regulator
MAEWSNQAKNPGSPSVRVPAVEASDGPIRVLVVDDEEDSRVLLTELLSGRDDIQIVGAAASVEEALELADVLRPQVVLVDWIMPGGGGPKAATDLQAADPEIRILGISGGEPDHASYEMMRGGATGFVPKGSSADEIASAVRSITRW